MKGCRKPKINGKVTHITSKWMKQKIASCKVNLLLPICVVLKLIMQRTNCQNWHTGSSYLQQR